MTPEQYSALLNEVLESNALARRNANEITLLRGAVTKLEGALTSAQGDIIVLGAKVNVSADDILSGNRTLAAVMQTIDGMNHLAKSAYDMASSHAKTLRAIEKHVGMEYVDQQEVPASERRGGAE